MNASVDGMVSGFGLVMPEAALIFAACAILLVAPFMPRRVNCSGCANFWSIVAIVALLFLGTQISSILSTMVDSM